MGRDSVVVGGRRGSTCRPKGAVLQAPPPTLNQSATAAAATATAAAAAAATAILSMSMALAANMKYHTAKPFSMNIKFRLTISISCTNVSVTKFALGLGQLGRDRQAKWGGRERDS